MQLWAVSVIVYFISSLSCHLFTFLETATPWNKWPVLLSHGQGCFLQLITSRNATDKNAFRLFAKKTNISSLSENITFPRKVNRSCQFFRPCEIPSLLWQVTEQKLMAHSGRPGRQAEPSATRGCRKPFPDISSPGGIFQAGGFCGLLGVGSGLSPPFSLFVLGCLHKQGRCSAVCASLFSSHPRSGSQNWLLRGLMNPHLFKLTTRNQKRSYISVSGF